MLIKKLVFVTVNKNVTKSVHYVQKIHIRRSAMHSYLLQPCLHTLLASSDPMCSKKGYARSAPVTLTAIACHKQEVARGRGVWYAVANSGWQFIKPLRQKVCTI